MTKLFAWNVHASQTRATWAKASEHTAQTKTNKRPLYLPSQFMSFHIVALAFLNTPFSLDVNFVALLRGEEEHVGLKNFYMSRIPKFLDSTLRQCGFDEINIIIDNDYYHI